MNQIDRSGLGSVLATGAPDSRSTLLTWRVLCRILPWNWRLWRQAKPLKSSGPRV